jgi:hypothetical protein
MAAVSGIMKKYNVKNIKPSRRFGSLPLKRTANSAYCGRLRPGRSQAPGLVFGRSRGIKISNKIIYLIWFPVRGGDRASL